MPAGHLQHTACEGLWGCVLRNILCCVHPLQSSKPHASVMHTDRNRVIASYKELVELRGGIGLQMQPIDRATFSTNSEVALALAEELDVRLMPSEEGIQVAGMAVEPGALSNMRRTLRSRQYAT